MKKLLLLILFGAVFFIACKKQIVSEPERIRPHKFVYLDSSSKALVNFKPGSYWIIRDTISMQTDSLFVYNYRNTLEEVRGVNIINDTNYIFEQITTNIVNKTESKFLLNCAVSSDTIIPPQNIVWTCVNSTFCGLGLNSQHLAFSKQGNSITNSYLADSVLVGGIWYKNIEVNYFKNLGANQTSFATGYTYWQKNKGLLKYYCNYNNTTTCYEMIRRNIVQ